MGQAASKSVQLSLMERDGTPTPSGRMSEAGPVQKQSPTEANFNLSELASRFLEHLSRVRRCSPRTIVSYKADYGKLTANLMAAGHDLDVRNISSNHIERCIAQLSHLSPESIRRFVYALRSLFEYLCKLEILSRNTAQDVPLPQKPHELAQAFSRDQADQLMAACETLQERIIVGLLRCCGLRRSELLSLDLADIGADFSSLRVSGKNHRQRDIPLHRDLRRLLQAHVASLPDSDEPALVRNRCGRRMSPTTLHRLFHKLLKRAELAEKGLSPHALRHHFASELIRAGVDIATVAALMGHSNISVTSRYLHSDAASKQSAVDSLPGIPASPAAEPDTPTVDEESLSDRCVQ